MAKPRQRDHLSAPATGGISLLTVFAVLALTVFALLSLSTVRADERLSLASAQAVRDYYAADNGAQEILARLRAGAVSMGNGHITVFPRNRIIRFVHKIKSSVYVGFK
ncbi:MAG: hypothetical protein HFF03_06390, partial [Oscillospiraceae bacterium]|nr:hypothetical protein [Oscillospiraceae bacterium]